MALAIGQARSSAARSLERLQARRLIKILDPGNAKKPAQILVRYLPESVHMEEPPPYPPPVFNMDRLRELLFKVRNPVPDMPEYDRRGRRISVSSSELVSPLGGLRALIIEKVALSPLGLTGSQIAGCLERRREKTDPLMPSLVQSGLLVMKDGTYHAPPDLLERLEAELERSGCNRAEERDRRRYEQHREDRREYVRDRRRQRDADGFIEDLVPVEPVEVAARAAGEPVEVPAGSSGEPETANTRPDTRSTPPPEATESPLSVSGEPSKVKMWPQPDPTPEADTLTKLDRESFRELAGIMRAEIERMRTDPAYLQAVHLETEPNRKRRAEEARRKEETRKAERIRRARAGGYRTGVAPEDFVEDELRGVTGMRWKEMRGRWEALGGDPEALESAVEAGPYRFKKEPMDFYQRYVYRSPARVVKVAESAA